ncbi:MAG: hypothetical protein KDD45_05935, partial [Bdellovibrionales bacterium]|nr:hypothetical protein [Bdellovibrionales bacterium]
RTWIAQIAYYFPLNYLRNMAVFQELKRWFNLNDFSKVIDYGAGLGTSSWCFYNETQSQQIFQFERENRFKNFWQQNSFHWIAQQEDVFKKITPSTLGIFSYSLTEIPKAMKLLEKFNHLVIIEPSLHDDGRRLMGLRDDLINRGFKILAPCVHQNSCPLLTHSKKDWCHDRIHFNKPEWLKNIEKHLPIKNDTLTFSYLIASKNPPIQSQQSMQPNLARITGDLLKEKGKSKQLICFNTERIFLSWLHKTIIPQEIGRGNLVQLANGLTQVSNELRISDDDSVKEIIPLV